MPSQERGSAARAGVSLTEDSVVCETGGGFTKTEWSVAVNDGWLSIADLIKRGRVGGITIEVEDEDDPHGVASGSQWVDRPAQVWYRRRTYVTAPVGTRFRQRVSTPVRDPAVGVRYSRSERDFELRGEGRIVAVDILEERAQRKARRAAQPEAPPTKADTLKHAGALLAKLGGEPQAEPTRPTEAPPDEAQTEEKAPLRRKRAVELKRPQSEPTPKKGRFPRIA